MLPILCNTLILAFATAFVNSVYEIRSETTEAVVQEDHFDTIENDINDNDPENAMERIHGTCLEELFEITAVIANGKFLLVYDPDEEPCINNIVEQQINLEWEKKGCIPGNSPGWNWYGEFEPGEINSFRMYEKINKELLLNETMYFLPEIPPPVEKVETEVGHGYVLVYITPPDEVEPNLLGYRVSLLDLEKSTQWKVVGIFENVVYRCTHPELWPVHPCPRWRTTRVFCALFSDIVSWKNNVSAIRNETMKYVQVETFRIPTMKRGRIHSRGVIHPLYTLETPTNETERSTVAVYSLTTSINADPEKEWEEKLWIILLVLTVSLLVAGLPLIHYRATRDGHNDARTAWDERKSSRLNCLTNCLNCCLDSNISWKGRKQIRYRGIKRKGSDNFEQID